MGPTTPVPKGGTPPVTSVVPSILGANTTTTTAISPAGVQPPVDPGTAANKPSPLSNLTKLGGGNKI